MKAQEHLKKARTLKEAQQLYQILVETAQDLIWQCDARCHQHK